MNLKINLSSSWKLFLISLACFIVMLLFVGIGDFFWSPPQGIHFSRQIDSFSYTYYYYIKGTNLLNPGNLNLSSTEARCASEFPIIYYITSLTYNYFGVNFLSLKVITIIFLFIGLLFCAKTIFVLSNSLSLSVILSLLFFSSTVILYYGTFYLPDIHALAFVSISFYYLFLYFRSKKNLDLTLIYLFITFSALLKASFFFYDLTFFILIYSFSKKNGLRSWTNISLFLLSTFIVFCWYSYAKRYNLTNGAWYYTIGPKPFWQSPIEKIKLALYCITNYWYSKYYFQSTFHFFFFTFLVGMFYLIKDRSYLLLISLLFFFNILYMSLFLTQFIDHDYYFIVIIPSIIIIVTLCLIKIREKFPNKFINYSIQITVLILVLLSFNYAKLNLHRRYTNNYDSNSAPRYLINGVDKFLDSLKISGDSKFLVVGDITQNGSLVFLKRFGWLYPNFSSDTTNLKNNLKVADYLLILKPSSNIIPKEIHRGLENCDKFIYYNNYIYSLKKFNK